MKLFGLIGYPLSHSFSKRYFTEKFEKEGISGHAYELFPISSIQELPALIAANPSLQGFNVTIPYKQEILPFLQELDPAAAAIGAVNTVKIFRNEEGKMLLKGFNTDCYGFELSIKPLLMPWHENALVLGNGGAAKAVLFILKKLGIRYWVVSRNPDPGDLQQLSYAQLNSSVLDHCKLIINTTPLGMSPDVESFPDLPYESIGTQHLLYDLVYNPIETAFMKKGRDQGAVAENGYNMLVLQAEKAWEVWNS